MGNLDWMFGSDHENTTAFQQYLRSYDWSSTDLGPIEQWCSELRWSVRFMAVDNQPTIIYWGPTRTIIYNEAYIPLVGNKHPSMLGKNAPDIFPDFWPYFEDIIRNQERNGKCASGEASRLLMERHGFLEETYFDWKLVPIIGDDGSMLGSYGIPNDRTKEVVNERRTECVRKLSQRLKSAITFDEMWTSVIAELPSIGNDAPFAMLYANDGLQGAGSYKSTFKLVGTLGVPKSHILRGTNIDLENGESGFSVPAREAAAKGRPIVIPINDLKNCEQLMDVDWQGSGSPCREVTIMPVMAGTKNSLILILGVNPHLRYNLWYEDFVRTLSDALSSQISRLRLSDEIKYRSDIASRATREFQQSEKRFARLASRSSVCLAVTDMSGQVLYANEAWSKFTSIEPSQVSQVNWRDTVFEEDLPLVEEWWYKVAVLKQNGTFRVRTKVPFKMGDTELPYRTGLCACYADLDEDSGLETVMGLIVDISEQKWIEDQLLQRTKQIEKSEMRYRMLADLSPLGILTTDRNGYVQFGNDAWHDFYGFEKGQVKDAQPWLAHVADEHLPKTKQYFEDLQTKKGPLTIELRLDRKFTMVEGDKVLENHIWVLATGIQEYSANGEIDHIDFWVTDISAQKMAAKLMHDKMEEAIRTRTQQERFIDMISHEIRNPLSAVLHCSEEIIETIKQCLQQPNGNVVTSSHANSPLEATLASALDAANTITYCVQHQKQIVDDVLTLSKLDSDLLIVSPVPVRLSDLIQSAAKIFEPELRMSKISLSIQEQESINQSSVEWLLLDPNRFRQILINLLTNAIKFTRGCDERKIQIGVSVHTKPPRDLEDVDYVPRKFRALERKGSYFENGDADGATQIYLRVSVSDTGKGLTEQEKKLLFKRFAQASPKTSVEYGGSGLGLFISRQITEMLGGEIGVGSSPSGGCTFAFYVTTFRAETPESAVPGLAKFGPPPRTKSAPVPLDPGQESRATVQMPNGGRSESPKPLGPRRVLVVEDNVINQKVLCKQLRNRGFDVEAANHGVEALSALERSVGANQQPFEIVLCDIEMPIMDGIECVEEIRRREEDGIFSDRIPIIGVTANVRSKQVDAALQAGMDGITTKPYRIDDLILHMDRLRAEHLTPWGTETSI